MYGQSLLLITTSRSISSCFCSFSSTVERILWRTNNANTFECILIVRDITVYAPIITFITLKGPDKTCILNWLMVSVWGVSISRSPWRPWSAPWVCGPSCWQSHTPRDQSPRGLSDPPQWNRSAALERSSASPTTQYCVSADALWRRTEDVTQLDEVKKRGRLCNRRFLMCKKLGKFECCKENTQISHIKPTDRWNEWCGPGHANITPPMASMDWCVQLMDTKQLGSGNLRARSRLQDFHLSVVLMLWLCLTDQLNMGYISPEVL